MSPATTTTTTPSNSGIVDHRLLIKDLLVKHASKISKVQEQIKDDPLYDSDRYDNIWILRFILSQGSVKKATCAAKRTMQFRHDQKLNELGDIRSYLPNHENPTIQHKTNTIFDVHYRLLTLYCKGYKDAIMYTLPDKNRGMVGYVTPSKIDQDLLMKQMTDEDAFYIYLYTSELIYQISDEITRRTGKLTKILRVFDMSNLSFGDMNRSYISRDCSASKQIEDYYPKILGGVLIVNAPYWATTIWKVIKHLFPKRFVDKMALISPNSNPKDVQYFSKYITRENLPERYGGLNKVWPPQYAGKWFENTK